MKNLIIAFLCLLTLPVVAETAGSNQPKKGKYHIKWVLAHEPIDLFKIASDSFTEEVTRKTNGEVTFEVISLPEYERAYLNGNNIKSAEFIKEVQSNNIQMTQTYTTDLASLNKKMYVLDLPFLFKDHDHAKRVLEGKIGENLLNGLQASNLKGLAFTYSGGYRVMPGMKKITKLEDFKGVSVRTSSSPIAQDTFKMLGATAVPLPLDSIEKELKSNNIDQAESTFARYYPQDFNKTAKVVNETNHSLFLTSIVINNKYWSTLPANIKEIMREAAITAARKERDYSIKAGDEIKAKLAGHGIEVVQLSKEESVRMKTALKPVYKKYEGMLTKELIASIENN